MNWHNKLQEKFRWYKHWHEEPHHHSVHWVVFLMIVLFFTGFLLGKIDEAYRVYAVGNTAPTLILDNFENGIRMANPNEAIPQYRDLWSQYTGDFTLGPDPGMTSIATSPVHDGSKSLKVHVDPRPGDGQGNLYLIFYPNSGYWRHLREFIQTGTWQNDTYNRMRFWVYLPSNVGYQAQVDAIGQHNLEIGTFAKCSTCDGSNPEHGGGHFYHHYYIPYTGAWHQIIFDMHPTHERGRDPYIEYGESKYYPSGETGYNYFDALTEFYLDLQGNLPNGGPPADFYFDGFELYQEARPENVNQVYSLNAVYVPETNFIRVGWNRRKDEPNVNYEVRYSFNDIHTIGWNSATPAPNGTVVQNGETAYNITSYKTNNINVSGQSKVYIAIKPQNSNLFRQIEIPISNAPTPSPVPPPNTVPPTPVPTPVPTPTPTPTPPPTYQPTPTPVPVPNIAPLNPNLTPRPQLTDTERQNLIRALQQQLVALIRQLIILLTQQLQNAGALILGAYNILIGK